MATNLALDPALIEEALKVSGERTKKAAVTRALLAQLCIRHKLVILTTDQDFVLAAKHCQLRVWMPG